MTQEDGPERCPTKEEFDASLRAILAEMTPAQLLAIPGVYEVMAEELNNQALEDWEAIQELKAELAAETKGAA